MGAKRTILGRIKKATVTLFNYFFKKNDDADEDGVPDANETDLDMDGMPDHFGSDFLDAKKHANDDTADGFDDRISVGSADIDGDGVENGDRDGDGLPDSVEDGLDAMEEVYDHRNGFFKSTCKHGSGTTSAKD